MPKLLVTGAPGVGKTTLIRAVVRELAGLKLSGFYTEELRGPRGRTGFRVVTLDGKEGPLATVGGEGPRVGRYAVQTDAFERLALPALAPERKPDLFVIDEIGRMECLSERFVQAVRRLLTGDEPLLATVALRGGGLIEEAKRTPGAELLEVTRANRDGLVASLVERLRA
ncbi:MAG: nucleoside-triphosphatase [Myxococcales bacterium]|jgi:nucleoside-triphosphatase